MLLMADNSEKEKALILISLCFPFLGLCVTRVLLSTGEWRMPCQLDSGGCPVYCAHAVWHMCTGTRYITHEYFQYRLICKHVTENDQNDHQ